MGLPVPFPRIKDIDDELANFNPGIRLFGRRFFIDQTVLELTAEFLAVVLAPKCIGSNEDFVSPLPPLDVLHSWASSSNQKLCYRLPIKLNLKLFALLCASPIDTRQKVHEDHYKALGERFAKRISSSGKTSQEIKEIIQDFLMGFQGAGFERDWCAQTFYPIASCFLAQEIIWNKTVAKKEQINDWNRSIDSFHRYYSVSKHRYLARGGELLYLQLCNLFAGKEKKRDFSFLVKAIDAYPDEADLVKLHGFLQEGLQRLRLEQFSALDKLVEHIEFLDSETHEKLNTYKKTEMYCEWCPEESWPEAYLFAVELNRVLRATLDPVERVELLQLGCALQVMRSLCAQSVRYFPQGLPKGLGGVLGYAWIFSPLEGFSRQQRLASCRNLRMVFRLIQGAINSEELVKNAKKHPKCKVRGVDWLLKEAENKYGHKFFRALGKRLGIIGPWRGAEPRFILTDKLLRYLVLSLLPPGERCEYHIFLQKLYCHYGIAIEGTELLQALDWSGLPPNSSVQIGGDSWFIQMLRAGGFLIELSDGCSIVYNPFSLY